MAIPVTVADGLWQSLADQCVTKMETYIGGLSTTQNKDAADIASVAQCVGEYYGWTEPRLQAWFDAMVAVRSLSGGYGVGTVFDGNPADTNYLITTACFVAFRMADGYDHGLVSQADFDKLLDCVRMWPCYAYNWGISGQPGALPDYSATPTNGTTAQHTDNRIWNVIAAAATFLLYNRNKHSVPASQTDCYNKGVAWKNAVVWAYNRPSASFNGWGYQGVAASCRQDGTHNWLCATMSPWLPGQFGPLRAQMAAGVVQGDIVAVSTGLAENNYLNGATTLMARHAEAFTAPSTPTGSFNFADHLYGRVAAQIAADSSNTSPVVWANYAYKCLMIHRKGMTL